jgi:hypothetical protein
VGVLVAKLVLAPSFVVGATLALRRWGPHVGGLLGGLPVVAGPILLVFALDHGRGFGADSATSALLGLVSLTAFVVVYGLLAQRHPWHTSLVAGWAAFLASTGVLSAADDVSAPLALVLAFASFAIGLAILTADTQPAVEPDAPPSWDLPVRALSALAMVLALTGAAGALGPGLSGLLAPFPIITSVLAAFTHAQRSRADVRRLLRGFLTGFVAFALFAFTVAVTIRSLGTAGAFSLALAVAVVVQLTVFLLGQRRATTLAT